MVIGARKHLPVLHSTILILFRATIRVGTPPQWVNVFPSTASEETWVIGLGGCDLTSLCASDRGGLFELNTSSTWQELNYYDLGLDPQLGFG